MPDQQNRKIIYVPGVEQMKCRECFMERQETAKGLIHLSRRKFVLAVERYFADFSLAEFRFAPTNESCQPGFCWSDVDARWISAWLNRDVSNKESRFIDIRNLEYQRQIDTYMRSTVSFYAIRVKQLGQAHGHPGWERL